MLLCPCWLPQPGAAWQKPGDCSPHKQSRRRQDRAVAKFHCRAETRNVYVAFVVTLLALLLLRWVYRGVKAGVLRLRGVSRI